MKTCPVCNAKAFDDAEVCYGCLHRFERKEGEVKGAHCKYNEDAPAWYEDYDPRDLEIYGCDDPFSELEEFYGDDSWFLGAQDYESAGRSTGKDEAMVATGAPAFRINMIPEVATMGEVKWRCNVEMVAP